MNNIIEKIKNNKKLVIIAASAVAAITLVIVIIALLSGPKTINIADYVSVEEFIGYDGYGTVVYEIDVDKFEDDLFEGEKLSDIPGAKRLFKTEEKAKKLFDIKIKNDGSLSNGDTVEIEVKYDSSNTFDCEIVDGIVIEKVKGLKKTTTIDLFENVEVEFSGISPKASLDIISGDTDLEIGFPNVSYTYENEGNLANGDVVVVTATVDDYEYEKERYLEHGYVFPETQEKEYTVEGLPAYMTKEEVKANYVEKLKQEAKAEMSKYYTVTQIMAFWGENTEDGYGTAVYLTVNYLGGLGLDYSKTFVYYNCNKATEGNVEQYSYEKRSSFADWDPKTQEQALENIKAKFPEYEIVSID